MAYFTGKKICENCSKDCTDGLWSPSLGTGGQLSEKMLQQLNEFQKKFGKTQMIWCWDCFAKAMGAKTLAEKETEKQKPNSVTVSGQLKKEK